MEIFLGGDFEGSCEEEEEEEEAKDSSVDLWRLCSPVHFAVRTALYVGWMPFVSAPGGRLLTARRPVCF